MLLQQENANFSFSDDGTLLAGNRGLCNKVDQSGNALEIVGQEWTLDHPGAPEQNAFPI